MTRALERLFGKRPSSRGPVIWRLWASGLALSLILGCAHRALETEPSSCIPHFPYAEGWLGGDAAYSVALPKTSPEGSDQRTLWLFGDTFVAQNPAHHNRKTAKFIHNSIGISRCTEAGFEIRYHWGQTAEHGAHAFLAPTPAARADAYVWLFGGFTHKGILYLGVLDVEPAPPQGPLALPFRLTGMQLARVDHPDQPPDRWRPTRARLSHSQKAFPGAAMVVHEEHVYFFSFPDDKSSSSSNFLARLPLEALDDFPGDLSGQIQTWTRQHQWETGFLPEAARPIMPDSASEMSVHFDASEKTWLALYGIPTGSPPQPGTDQSAQAIATDSVYARSAPRLTGPWSSARDLYSLPTANEKTAPDGTFCYAAKAHPELSPPDHLVITYVCSLKPTPTRSALETFSQLQDDLSLYVPQVVVLPWPPESLTPSQSHQTLSTEPGARTP
ncbi:MAG: DUF4185 domain-containing protein [Myxococcota bacterium]|nr:DUF4185 domain-containing protein [Myxococcota bacterium]